MNVLFLVFVCVGLGVVGQLVMKKGMNSIGNIGMKDIISPRIFEILLQKYVFIGLVLYVVGSLIWLVVLSQEELSFVYPLIAIGYVITAILSKLFFNESLTFFRFLGILLIFGGVYLIVLRI
ncbi:MAG: EamA family transporter [Candidatus Aenigmarchaeota archaeon]|nr:EamA family transporter [Candidatus Aenigmarchaeota archaeon]